MSIKENIKEELKLIDNSYFIKVYISVRDKTLIQHDLPYNLALRRSLIIRELAINYDWNTVLEILSQEFKIKNKKMFKETWSHVMYIENIILNKNYKLMEEVDVDDDFLIRLLIRLKLIKQGWSCKSINNLLTIYYKDLDYKAYSFFIFQLFIKELFNIDYKKEGRGRPKVPKDIKLILTDKIKEKNVTKMRNIYNLYNIVKNFKIEDIITLINSCKEERVKEILSRLKNYIENKNNN